MPSIPIAVTGATGRLGGRIAARLAAAGLRQRLLVREAARAPALPGTDIAVATYDDLAASTQALQRYSSRTSSVVGCDWQVRTTPAASSSGSRA